MCVADRCHNLCVRQSTYRVLKTKWPYTNTLDTISRLRYLQKVSLCGGIDPYALKKKDFGTDLELYPAVEFPDILLHHETDEMEEYGSLQLLCVRLGERPWREKAA